MNDAKSYLQQVELIDTHINNNLDELDRLRAMTTKVTTTLKQDVVSGSGNQDKLGDAVARIVDLENEINQAIDAYVDRKKSISAILEQMNDSDQIKVLHKRYFEYKQWEQIACEMCMTYRNVCYIHGRALQTVDAMLRGNNLHEKSTAL